MSKKKDKEINKISKNQRLKDLKNLFNKGVMITGNKTKELSTLLDEGFIKIDQNQDGDPCFVKK